MALYSIERAEAIINEYIPDERYRMVLILRICRNMSYEAIGEATGFSPSWVKQIIKKYRKEILQILSQSCPKTV